MAFAKIALDHHTYVRHALKDIILQITKNAQTCNVLLVTTLWLVTSHRLIASKTVNVPLNAMNAEEKTIGALTVQKVI